MAEEHADELMVAHMDGRMRAAQPASGLDPELGPMLDFANAGEIAFYDYAVAQHCRATLDILDGKDNGAGACNEPWASVRKRLLSIVELHQSSSAAQGESVPAGVQQPDTAYADLMQAASDWICEHVENGTPGVMIWAIRLQSAAQKLRASHGQAPAQAAPAAMHSDLRARCVEVLAWRETGTLPGEALRTLAREKYGDRYDAIQRAERDTETEALNFVAARKQGANHD